MKQPLVAIVGAALSDCGRVDDKAVFELHHQAASRTLADAGLTHADVDGFCSVGTGFLPPIERVEYLGLRPTYVDSTSVGGTAWKVMVEHAAAAIEVGMVKTVLVVYGSTARADLKRAARSPSIALPPVGPMQFDEPWGHSLVARYAMVAQRHMYEHGTTIDRLADIAVDTKYNASLSPNAYYRAPIARQDAHTSRAIPHPLTKLHACIRSDGGGAIVKTSLDRAKDLAHRPVQALGTGSAMNTTTMSDWMDLTVSPAAVSFERAGLTPSDGDLRQFYDSFTITVLLTFEALGFCPPGEAGRFLEGGTTRVGGSMPTNTAGSPARQRSCWAGSEGSWKGWSRQSARGLARPPHHFGPRYPRASRSSRPVTTASDPHFYPRPFCPHCWSTEVRWTQASGFGTVYSHSVVRANDHPAFGVRGRYVAVLIDLDEGPRMISVIDGDLGGIAIGDLVEVYFEARRSIHLPIFRVRT